MTIICAKCRKPEVIGEVSIQRSKTFIKLYFCSNQCSKALAKALPAKLK